MCRSFLRIVFFFCLLCLLTVPVQAQEETAVRRITEELRARAERGLRDAVTVRMLLDLAQEYRKSDPERALETARQAEALAREIGDNAGLAMVFTSSGITYAQQGAWVRALNFFLKSLRLKEELGDEGGMAALLSNIGIVHGRLNDQDRALRYHERAVKFFERAGDRQGLAYAYNNIGVISMDQGGYDDAIRSFQQSLALKKELRDRPGIASTYLNLGITYYLLDALPRALENLEYSAKIYASLGEKHGMAEAMHRIGMVYLRQQQPAKAFDAAQNALRIARATNSRAVERNVLHLCSDIKEAMGEPAAALDYFRQYTALKDSLFNEESAKRINEMTANYESAQRERSERENELLKKEQRIREMELERRAILLHDQQRDIELLNRNREISTLQLKEQEAIVRAQRLEAADQESKISLLSKDRELLERDRALKEAELKRQAWLRNTFILSSVLLVIILGLVANRYRLKKRSEEMFRQKTGELERANSAIRKHEALLEAQAEEIERTNEELTRQNALLEQLNTEKNELLGIVSHDLRNPIGGIRMLAESIAEEGRSTAYMQRKAMMVYDTADELLELVRNLLDVNRLESGRMQLDSEAVPVRPILDRVVGDHERWAQKKDIRVQVDAQDGAATVQGDDAAVKQILDNLLSNALKYSPQGKDVFVSLGQGNGQVRMEVRDEGPGISAEDRALLFQKFAKLSARPSAGEYSTGLGLFIVKKLVETMHGDIRCESAPGEGARFIVRLPAAP